jgi:hypothetical protein
MSIQAFKKKAVLRFGAKSSGKPPGGYWLSQGPFGEKVDENAIGAAGLVGFSLNGSRRNVGYVGQHMMMSRNGTPFRGAHPYGIGSKYAPYNCAGSTCPGKPAPTNDQMPVFNANRALVLGDQFEYVKPTVLTTKGMLERKYKGILHGTYPNTWVQPVYPSGSLSDNSSQWLYIQTKAAANICVNDTNKPEVYVGHRIRGGPNGCSTSSAKYVYKIQESNAGYTKTLAIPQTASQYTLQVQRKCSNPTGALKPFPFAVNGGSSNASAPYAPIPVAVVNYDAPPEWYIKG